MGRPSVFWILVVLLAILALAASPAGGLVASGSGGAHVACGSTGTGGCQ